MQSNVTTRLCYNNVIMKKLYQNIILFIALISLSFVAPVGAVAVPVVNSASSIQASDLFSGQRHSYSVIFRGNGEALTFAKVIFTNTTDEDMTKFTFEVPGVEPSEIEIYQMQLKGKCLAYLSTSIYTEDDLSDDICQQYEEGNYDNDYYYSYYGNNNQAEYSKISGKNLVQDGSKFSLNLPVTVAPNKTSSLVIAYAAKGYVTESFGLFKFNFETIKVPSRIKELKVAIDVDSDLILKGKNATVNYGTTKKTAVTAGVAQDSFSSGRLDNIIGSIGNYTQLTKTASNLSKSETYTVKGEYSTNWFRLYLDSIVTTVLIIIAIVLAIILLSKYLKRRNGRKKEATALEAPAADDASAYSVEELASGRPKVVDEANSLPRMAVWGLISATATVVVYFTMQFISSSGIISQIGGYSNGISVLFGLAGIMMILASLFGPAITVSIKRGWKYLVPIILFEIFWIVVFVFLLAILYSSGLTNMSHSTPAQ